MLDGARFIIIDSRTGQQAASGVWSEASAWAQIVGFYRRHLRGGRPDITADDLDYLTVRDGGRNAAVPPAGNGEAQR